MKAEILMDPASKAGILRVVPETEVEAFALHHFWHNYNMGNHSSIFYCQTDIPGHPQIPAEKSND